MTARNARFLSYAALTVAAALMLATLGPWSLSMGTVAMSFLVGGMIALVLFWHSAALARMERAERSAREYAHLAAQAELAIPHSRTCDHALTNGSEENDEKAMEQGEPAFEGDGIELVLDEERLRRVIRDQGTGMPMPGSVRRAKEHPETLPQREDIKAELAEKLPLQFQQTVYASPWQMHLLRDQTVLNLGRYADFDLIAHVPRDFEPTLERDAMLSAYLGPWLDVHTLSFDDAEANVKKWKQGEPEGLFWTGEGGYLVRAWLWAIVTTHSFAHLVDDITDATRYAPVDYREMVEQGKLSLRFILGSGTPGYIEHNADGRIVSHNPDNHPLAWTYFGQIRIKANTRLWPQLADYYMWWAWRLYAWAREGDGGYLEEFMGLCCARAAMAEIAQMATLIVHEVGHLKGSSYHCHSGVGFFDCSQYLMEWTFLHRTLAALGLPLPHYPNFGGDVGPSILPTERFMEYYVSATGTITPRTWSASHSGSAEFSGFGEFQEAWAEEPDCRSATASGAHVWLMRAARPVTVTYHVPWHCSKEPADQDGTINYT